MTYPETVRVKKRLIRPPGWDDLGKEDAKCAPERGDAWEPTQEDRG